MEDINIISTDDMAKLKVGAPAVSRYHQLSRLYGVSDQPNLSDHDFPTPGYLLNTSGYMFLEDSEMDEIDYHHSTYDTHQQPVDSLLLDAMELQYCPDDSVRDLPDAIVDQLEKHLNIKTTADDLKDLIISEIRQFQGRRLLNRESPIFIY